MAQFGRPVSDVTVSDWTTASLFDKIDEATFSDADFISSDNNTNSSCEVGLTTTLADPTVHTGHIVRYRYRKSAASGNARNITVSLYQGTTLIAEQTHTGISETFTAGSFTLTSTEAGNITDYTNLRLRFTSGGTTGGPGGNRRSVQVSWAELEIPDVPLPPSAATGHIFLPTQAFTGSNLTTLPTYNSNFSAPQGSFVIASNRAYSGAGDAYAIWMPTPVSGDYDVRAQITQLSASSYAGLVARYTDPNNHYQIMADQSTGQWRLDRRVGGVQTNLAGVAISGTGPWNLEIRLRGTQLSVLVDGVMIAQVTDASFATGVVGLRGGSVTTTTGWHFDDFQAQDTVAATGRATGTVFIPTDTFTGTAGTDLSTYNSNWENWAGDGGHFVISDANRLRLDTGTGVRIATHASLPATAEYDVRADFYLITDNDTAVTGIMGRVSPNNPATDLAAHDGYLLRYNTNGNLWELCRTDNNVRNVLGSYADTPALLTNHAVELRIRDASKRVVINAVERIVHTDNTYGSAGKVGIFASGTVSNVVGLHLDNFQVQDTVLATGRATGDIIVPTQDFAGTSGQAVEAWNADWVPFTGGTPGTHIHHISDAGRSRGGSSTVNMNYYHANDPITAEYDVRAKIHLIAAKASAFAGIFGRANSSDAAVADMYRVVYSNTSVAYVFQRFSDGASTNLASVSRALIAGEVDDVELRLRDTTKKVIVNGIEIASSTDDTFTGAGHAGIIHAANESNTAGFHIDDFGVQDVATAAAPPGSYTGWLPTDLGTKLKAWFRADDIVGLQDGDRVSPWNDSSGTGNNATNATETSRPRFRAQRLNGRAAVEFIPTNVLDFALPDNDRTEAMLGVFDNDVNGGGGEKTIVGPTGDTGRFFSIGQNGQPWMRTWVSTLLKQHSVTVPIDTPTIIGYDMTDTDCAVSVNGAWESAATTTTFVGGGTSRIGFGPNANAYDGLMFEVGITDSPLTTEERQLWEGYLAHYYGITGNLDAGHPYKTDPPPAPSPGATGTIFVPLETFTDTAGTELSTHDPDWTYFGGVPSIVITTANRVRSGGTTNNTGAYHANAPVSAEYDVRCGIVRLSDRVNVFLGPAGRLADTGSTTTIDGYRLVYSNTSQAWVLQRIDTGTTTNLGSFSHTLTANQEYTAELRIRDASKKAVIDGLERISSTNNTYTAAGVAGFYVHDNDSDTDGYHLDNFEVQDVVVAGAATGDIFVATDPFTAADGTDLTAYNANWQNWINDGGHFVIHNNTIRATSSTACLSTRSETPVSTDYDVRADISLITDNNSSTAGIGGRLVDPSNDILTYDGYIFRHNTANSQWQLFRITDGVGSVIASYTGDLPTVGNPVSAELRIRSDSKKGLLNGVLRVSHTDNTYAEAGRVGVHASGTISDTVGLRIDNFQAQDVLITGDLAVATGDIFVATDTFTGTAETDLATYDVNWTQWGPSTTITDANRAKGSTQTAVTVRDETPLSNEYDVRADVHILSDNNSSAAGVVARAVQTSGVSFDGYHARYNTSGDAWQLFRMDAGTGVTLGSFGEVPTTGVNHALELRVRNEAKALYRDGVQILISTDNTYTAAGSVGIRWIGTSNNNATGVHLDNFQAQDVQAASGDQTITLTKTDLALATTTGTLTGASTVTTSASDLALNVATATTSQGAGVTMTVSDLALGTTAIAISRGAGVGMTVGDLSLGTTTNTLAIATTTTLTVSDLALTGTTHAVSTGSGVQSTASALTVGTTSPTISAASQVSMAASDLSLNQTSPVISTGSSIQMTVSDLALGSAGITITLGAGVALAVSDLALGATAITAAAAVNETVTLAEGDLALGTTSLAIQIGASAAITASDLSLGTTATTIGVGSTVPIIASDLSLGTMAITIQLGAGVAMTVGDVSLGSTATSISVGASVSFAVSDLTLTTTTTAVSTGSSISTTAHGLTLGTTSAQISTGSSVAMTATGLALATTEGTLTVSQLVTMTGGDLALDTTPLVVSTGAGVGVTVGDLALNTQPITVSGVQSATVATSAADLALGQTSLSILLAAGVVTVADNLTLGTTLANVQGSIVPQIVRPVSDVTVSDWTTAPLFDKIDEEAASDADFIASNNNTNNFAEVALDNPVDPQVSNDHIVRYRYAKSAAAGNARNITVGLYQGTTLIAEQTHTGITEVWTAGSFTLTGPQADSITDYSDLRLRFTAGGTTGGGGSVRRSVQVSWAELQVPGAGTVSALVNMTKSDLALNTQPITLLMAAGVGLTAGGLALAGPTAVVGQGSSAVLATDTLQLGSQPHTISLGAGVALASTSLALGSTSSALRGESSITMAATGLTLGTTVPTVQVAAGVGLTAQDLLLGATSATLLGEAAGGDQEVLITATGLTLGTQLHTVHSDALLVLAAAGLNLDARPASMGGGSLVTLARTTLSLAGQSIVTGGQLNATVLTVPGAFVVGSRPLSISASSELQLTAAGLTLGGPSVDLILLTDDAVVLVAASLILGTRPASLLIKIPEGAKTKICPVCQTYQAWIRARRLGDGNELIDYECERGDRWTQVATIQRILQMHYGPDWRKRLGRRR